MFVNLVLQEFMNCPLFARIIYSVSGIIKEMISVKCFLK